MKKAFDATGVEITVGCMVKHKVPAAEPKAKTARDPWTIHNFFHVSPVKEILPHSGFVVVESVARTHIPVHLPQNLIVVD